MGGHTLGPATCPAAGGSSRPSSTCLSAALPRASTCRLRTPRPAHPSPSASLPSPGDRVFLPRASTSSAHRLRVTFITVFRNLSAWLSTFTKVPDPSFASLGQEKPRAQPPISSPVLSPGCPVEPPGTRLRHGPARAPSAETLARPRGQASTARGPPGEGNGQLELRGQMRSGQGLLHGRGILKP